MFSRFQNIFFVFKFYLAFYRMFFVTMIFLRKLWVFWNHDKFVVFGSDRETFFLYRSAIPLVFPFALFSALNGNKSVTKIDFRSNSFKPIALGRLAAALKTELDTPIEVLNLSKNRIGERIGRRGNVDSLITFSRYSGWFYSTADYDNILGGKLI